MFSIFKSTVRKLKERIESLKESITKEKRRLMQCLQDFYDAGDQEGTDHA